jgi:hypothetical protein
MNYSKYDLYKLAKSSIETTKKCCDNDHSDNPTFIFFQELTKLFDELYPNFSVCYEQEKNNDYINQRRNCIYRIEK